MSYNDLTTIKRINGVPADLTFYEKVSENDSLFKTVTDADEDLSELDRDILPTIDNMFELGSNDKAFHRINVRNVKTGYVNILSGNLAIPALQIGLAGFSSLNNNELSFIGTSGLESLRFMTSGFLIRAANNTQLKIENTLPGSEALWSLGCDENGFKIGDSVLFKTNSSDFFNTLKIQNGTLLFPALSFLSDATTGLWKDPSTAVLNFSLSGAKRLALSSAALELLSNQLVLPLSSLTVPSLAFTDYLGTGLGTITGSELNLLINNQTLHSFKPTGFDAKLEVASEFNYSIFSNSETHRFSFNKSKGTVGLPLAVGAEETIYKASFKGHDGLDFVSGAEIVVKSEEAYGVSFGTGIYLRTCTTGDFVVENKLNIGQAQKPDVFVPKSIGIEKLTLDTPGSALNINVKHISKIMVDTTSGTIELAGFTGGQEGQMLYIYKKVTANTLRILFNNGSGTQKVLLKDSSDYTNTDNYGGIILSFDDGVWREISRS